MKNLELGITNEELKGNLTPDPSPKERGDTGQREARIKEYFKMDALSSGKLADFYLAPDYVLMERVEKPYFDEGRAFEMMVEDRAKGTSLLKDNFFVAKIDGGMPKELPQWIADGTLDEQ
jgi:hypothetical protein